jgi:2'-5' RNA ligase
MKSLKRGPLYFIAIIPPSPILEDALKLKHYFKDYYHSKASLNSPPHITLHMPFQWKEEKETLLIKALEDFNPDVASFNIKLSGFGSFPPRVIFIDVEKSEMLLQLHTALHQYFKKSLNIFNANYKDKPFHPHITLAFRDLKKTFYAQAWEEFTHKKYSAEFMVNKFTLLKHNGKIWEAFKEFNL